MSEPVNVDCCIVLSYGGTSEWFKVYERRQYNMLLQYSTV